MFCHRCAFPFAPSPLSKTMIPQQIIIIAPSCLCPLLHGHSPTASPPITSCPLLWLQIVMLILNHLFPNKTLLKPSNPNRDRWKLLLYTQMAKPLLMNVLQRWQLSFISLYPLSVCRHSLLLLISIIIQNRQPSYLCYMSQGSASACHLLVLAPSLSLFRSLSISVSDWQLAVGLCQAG